MNGPINLEFVKAANDYAGLLNKNYPQKPLLRLVGDRYQLSGEERAMIYRGVTSEKESKLRNLKLIATTPDKNDIIHVDFFNQLYHVISYLKGNRVFISTDGFLRDASEFHGNKIPSDLLNKAIQMFSLYISVNITNQLKFYVDEQVNLFSEILKQIEESNVFLNVKTFVHPSTFVDKELISQTSGIIATSDSQIIDKTKICVFDLARNILEFHFQPDLLDLFSILR